MQPTLENAVKEVYYWQYANTGSFYNLLCTLYQKADPWNKHRLKVAFPEIAEAMELWLESENPEDLFREYKLID